MVELASRESILRPDGSAVEVGDTFGFNSENIDYNEIYSVYPILWRTVRGLISSDLSSSDVDQVAQDSLREVLISNTATLAASHEWMGVASHGIYRSGWTQPRGTNSEPNTSERDDKGVIVSRNCTLEKVQIRGFTNSSDVDTVAMALRLYRADIFSTSVVSYSDDDEIIFNDIISDASNISTSSDQGIEIVLNKEVLRGQKICAYFKPYGSFTVNRSYLFEANFIFK